VEAPKPTSGGNLKMTEPTKGREIYSSTGTSGNVDATPLAVLTPTAEEEDDLDAPVKSGTPCRRNGCRTTFVSNDVNRIGVGEGTICTYHSAPVRLDVPFRNMD
jgi:hypothetical protein